MDKHERKTTDSISTKEKRLSRRQFIVAAGVVGAGVVVGGQALAQQAGQQSGADSGSGADQSSQNQPPSPSGSQDNAPSESSRKNTGALGNPSPGPGAPKAVVDGPIAGSGDIPRRPLGRTGLTVSAIGLGGHHLGDADTVNEAMNIVHEAMDYGINFFDNCWEYHNGKTEDWLGRALAGGRRDNAILMTKVCTHGRSRDLAMKMLEESLRRLQTDHLDVWQIHAITYDNDPELAYAKGGVLEAFDLAKQQGKVRFVGFTGHKDPGMHLHMLELGYPFDTCQFPLNPFDYGFFSFERQVLPEVNRRNIAPLGMKSMGGNANAIKNGMVTAEDMLRYAMSLPVATTISGIDSLDVLHQNLRVARGFTPMSPSDMDDLRKLCAPAAVDGRMEPYKVSLQYDNPMTRIPHGFAADKTQREMVDISEQMISWPGEIMPIAGTVI